MAQRFDVHADVVCPACGGRRTITSRQRRRIVTGEADARCRLCRYDHGERPAPDDSDRLYWLQRFTDEEIAAFSRFVGGRGDVEAVRAWRERLLTGNSPQPVRRQAQRIP